jgi:hypothetical protein
MRRRDKILCPAGQAVVLLATEAALRHESIDLQTNRGGLRAAPIFCA